MSELNSTLSITNFVQILLFCAYEPNSLIQSSNGTKTLTLGTLFLNTLTFTNSCQEPLKLYKVKKSHSRLPFSIFTEILPVIATLKILFIQKCVKISL